MSGTADVEARVRALLAQVLDVPASDVGPGFSEASTATWTSLNHLMLVSQLESEFGLFLSNEQIRQLTSFDRIVETVARHRSGG
ncbi:MAG TPA: acyl carrier protein [Gemmatimonadales bacterium]|nr:acyl carrier protein [Gemmatimonadales bacterium]